jgi:hypothetical protein
MVLTLICCAALAYHNPEDKLVFGLLGLTILLLGSVSFHCRSFALKVQDRTIILEENFRHYRLTGEPLNAKLKLEQIIALRFASDAEFPNLCNKAIEENLSNTQIKQLIKTWKADYLRA